MSLTINIHQLERKALILKGELEASEMEWDTRDAMIQIHKPLQYELHAEQLEKSILVQGLLRQALDCECVRCLKSFVQEVKLERWSCLLELTGEEKVSLVNDCVDLTPYIREDMFLAFPQHPLCGPQCNGLAIPQKDVEPGGSWESGATSSTWAELDKLKFE
jgi:uncharacterized metal-binding protein YceD (DUF177 family)